MIRDIFFVNMCIGGFSMKNSKLQIGGLLLSILFVYIMLFFTFHVDEIFWYLYTFTLLVGMAIAIVNGKAKDELPTWQYLIYGVGYGTVTYGIVRLGYIILSSISSSMEKQVDQFLNTFGPTNSWQYVLLIFVIVIGEEMFWRSYVQQFLKRWMSSGTAVVVTSLLFSLSLLTSGFYLGVIAALVSGLIWGWLYEWKKSMPLIIISHETFVLLLFLVLPL